MSERSTLRPAAEWVELRATDEDWARADLPCWARCSPICT